MVSLEQSKWLSHLHQVIKWASWFIGQIGMAGLLIRSPGKPLYHFSNVPAENTYPESHIMVRINHRDPGSREFSKITSLFQKIRAEKEKERLSDGIKLDRESTEAQCNVRSQIGPWVKGELWCNRHCGAMVKLDCGTESIALHQSSISWLC